MKIAFSRVWGFVTGVPAVIFTLLWLMVLITLGTLAQATMPLVQAQQLYFSGFVLWLGGIIPVPGMAMTLAFLAFNLAVQTFMQPLTSKTFGSWLTHAGVLMLILSGLAATVAMQAGYVAGKEGVPTRLWQAEGDEGTAPSTWPTLGLLPFTVTVHTFHHVNHPGTTIPAYFASDVTVTPEDPSSPPFSTRIEMNDPLRTQGYTLYQASYILMEGEPPISILSVVKDRTRLLPWLATGVIGLGLLLHLLRRARMLFLPAVFLFAVAGPVAVVRAESAPAASPTEVERFYLPEETPVQHQGRVKPLGTVAAVIVPFVTGQSMAPDEAMRTLNRWLLTPAVLSQEVVFTIKHPQTVASLGLMGVPQPLQLSRVIEALLPHQQELESLAVLPAAKLSAPQKELLAVQERAEVLLSVARTFAMLAPLGSLDEAMATALGLQAGPVSAAMLLHRRGALLTLTQAMASGTVPTDQDKAVFKLVSTLKQIKPEQPNALLRFLPPESSEAPPLTNPEWLSPWQAAHANSLTPEQRQALNAWQAFIFHQGDAPYVPMGALPHLRLHVEVMTLHYPPITLSLIPLLFAFGFSFIRRGGFASRLFEALGFLTLAVGLLARIIILGRPPVATLYESVLFVAFVVLMMGMLFRKKHEMIMPAALGLTVFLVAISHGLTQGTDTMGMLMAVLNTNFWLATHVLMITGGYGASLLTGGLAMILLFRGAFGVLSRDISDARAHVFLRHLTTLSLLMVAVGTLLGGVWAAESWGRFWGWDPKENGALVLTLWLAVCVHIRLLKPVPVPLWLASCALTPVIVALSWFGVNLLGVGLHSYGFTSGLATYLTLFCVSWSVFVSSFMALMARRT
ncbi:MAG: hypothetical protein COY40_05210 [Alphaproteobacteria bacterium CG_4_10_14_0_8_um_filter_53_9]|nr:MAG: hypothetical protein COY40_05210 [Alphaproteobacteria bacterium CG_4_10_14_0_8_um_filter_53_9]